MGLLSSILRNGTGGRLSWWCPGCNRPHQVIAQVSPKALPSPNLADADWTPPQEFYAARDGAWSWNGSAAKPTFMPSVLVSYDGTDAGQDGTPPRVCHSFVVNGEMQFLGDCTHALAGKTVPIPDWPRPNWSD